MVQLAAAPRGMRPGGKLLSSLVPPERSAGLRRHMAGFTSPLTLIPAPEHRRCSSTIREAMESIRPGHWADRPRSRIVPPGIVMRYETRTTFRGQIGRAHG